MTTHSDLVSFELVQQIKDLARKQKSPMLAQLASKMNSAVKLGSSEGDVFAKIKGLINDMIAKLEKEAEADATEAAYCEKETSETTAKKEDNDAEIKKLSTKIDQATARSGKLKQEVATLQEELANLAKSQAEMDGLRAEEKATFKSNEAELQQGVAGVQLALKVLKDYYSKSPGSGAGQGIISLLEVAESDMSKDLSELTTIEKTAQSDYDAQTKENDLTRTTKAQDEKYKTSEFTSLDKAVGDLSSDLEGVNTEQAAVLEYLAKINERCVAKAPSYSEIKARREAEISGLQDALETLESETALLQKSSTRTLRGLYKHSVA
jgi:predicted  nucleic acid-binding Zn-ribbon protein